MQAQNAGPVCVSRWTWISEFQISRNGKSISGRGQVVNISSKALAFRTEGPICPDMRLRVFVAWPVRLDECKLRLVFEGVVLRARDGLVVATIERPQFRTAGSDTGAARQEKGVVASAIGARVCG